MSVYIWLPHYLYIVCMNVEYEFYTVLIFKSVILQNRVHFSLLAFVVMTCKHV